MPEQNILTDSYVCPNCGKQGMINAIVPLIGNVRYDAVQCECGSHWRVYYEFTNPHREIMYIPDPVKAVDEAKDVVNDNAVEE